jgi:hypothetical protein
MKEIRRLIDTNYLTRRLTVFILLLAVFAMSFAGCAGSVRGGGLPSEAEYIVVEGVGYEPPERPTGQARLMAKLEATALARRAIWDGLMSGRFEVVNGGVADESESLVWLATNDSIFASRLRALIGDVQIYASKVGEKDRSVRVWLVMERNSVAELVREARVRLARGE